MQPQAFDRYQAGHSLLHRLDPRVKVVLTVFCVVGNALLPDGAWLALLLTWGIVLIANQLSELGIGFTFRRSFVALPFALAAVTIIFTLPGRPLITIPLGTWQLVVSDTGLVRFISIVVRSWLSVQVAILLAATTQFPALMNALGALHVPQPIVAIISFMYRYLFVLVDEAQRLLRARQSRSASLATVHNHLRTGGSLGWRAKVAGNMAGQLFLRSYERSDRVYNAMLARGYTGQMRMLNSLSMKQRDWLGAAVTVAALVVVQVVGRFERG